MLSCEPLVIVMLQAIKVQVAEERKRLESEWERRDQISTEDLRQAMRRYRSFFERLLSV